MSVTQLHPLVGGCLTMPRRSQSIARQVSYYDLQKNTFYLGHPPPPKKMAAAGFLSRGLVYNNQSLWPPLFFLIGNSLLYDLKQPTILTFAFFPLPKKTLASLGTSQKKLRICSPKEFEFLGSPRAPGCNLPCGILQGLVPGAPWPNFIP